MTSSVPDVGFSDNNNMAQPLVTVLEKKEKAQFDNFDSNSEEPLFVPYNSQKFEEKMRCNILFTDPSSLVSLPHDSLLNAGLYKGMRDNSLVNSLPEHKFKENVMIEGFQCDEEKEDFRGDGMRSGPSGGRGGSPSGPRGSGPRGGRSGPRGGRQSGGIRSGRRGGRGKWQHLGGGGRRRPVVNNYYYDDYPNWYPNYYPVYTYPFYDPYPFYYANDLYNPPVVVDEVVKPNNDEVLQKLFEKEDKREKQISNINWILIALFVIVFLFVLMRWK